MEIFAVLRFVDGCGCDGARRGPRSRTTHRFTRESPKLMGILSPIFWGEREKGQCEPPPRCMSYMVFLVVLCCGLWMVMDVMVMWMVVD